jgi:hypothetical protein
MIKKGVEVGGVNLTYEQSKMLYCLSVKEYYNHAKKFGIKRVYQNIPVKTYFDKGDTKTIRLLLNKGLIDIEEFRFYNDDFNAIKLTKLGLSYINDALFDEATSEFLEYTKNTLLAEAKDDKITYIANKIKHDYNLEDNEYYVDVRYNGESDLYINRICFNKDQHEIEINQYDNVFSITARVYSTSHKMLVEFRRLFLIAENIFAQLIDGSF